MAIDLLVAGHHSPEGQLEVTPGQGGGRLAVPTDQNRKIKVFMPGQQGREMLLRMAERLELGVFFNLF